MNGEHLGLDFILSLEQTLAVSVLVLAQSLCVG